MRAEQQNQPAFTAAHAKPNDTAAMCESCYSRPHCNTYQNCFTMDSKQATRPLAYLVLTQLCNSLGPRLWGDFDSQRGLGWRHHRLCILHMQPVRIIDFRCKRCGVAGPQLQVFCWAYACYMFTAAAGRLSLLTYTAYMAAAGSVYTPPQHISTVTS